MRATFLLILLLVNMACLSPTAPKVYCESMTRTACTASPHCILDKTEDMERGVYECRVPKNECEREFARNGKCSNSKGCKLLESDCYCKCRGYGRTKVEDGWEAEDCSCACSGGPPRRCVEADGDDEENERAR